MSKYVYVLKSDDFLYRFQFSTELDPIGVTIELCVTYKRNNATPAVSINMGNYQ